MTFAHNCPPAPLLMSPVQPDVPVAWPAADSAVAAGQWGHKQPTDRPPMPA